MNCRFCGANLKMTFVDLGMQPLSNAYVVPDAADGMEPFYPLHARVCEKCFLVQVPELQSPQRIFDDYAYLSSMSDSWVDHCRRYAREMIDRFGLNASSLVVEVASNDGCLLRFFKNKGIRALGIEPASNIAVLANAGEIPTLTRFFGSELARELVAEGIGELESAVKELKKVPS